MPSPIWSTLPRPHPTPLPRPQPQPLPRPHPTPLPPRPPRPLAAVISQARRENPYLRPHTIADGNDAIADELLPELFGGPWTRSRSWHSLVGRDWRSVLDHGAVFRRQGIRGRSNWNNAIAVGQPYCTRPDHDVDMRAEAARLWSEHGVTVWWSAAHSFWFQPFTVLVVAGRGIDPARARTRGFSMVRSVLQ